MKWTNWFNKRTKPRNVIGHPSHNLAQIIRVLVFSLFILVYTLGFSEKSLEGAVADSFNANKGNAKYI